MGGAFDRIGLPVGPVVGGIHLPAVTGSEVVLVANAVHHGITHLHVLVVHVDLRPHHGAFVELAGGHAAKRSRFSSTLRSRQGESTPGVVKPPGSPKSSRVLVVDVGEALSINSTAQEWSRSK